MRDLCGASGLVVSALLVISCSSTPHIGSWASDTPDAYTGLSLEPNGRCRLLGIERKVGTGGGGWCSYIYRPESETILITEMWDKSKVRHKPPQPVEIKFDRTRDVLVWAAEGHTITLSRANEILGKWED
jgi:hypothetical protein